MLLGKLIDFSPHLLVICFQRFYFPFHLFYGMRYAQTLHNSIAFHEKMKSAILKMRTAEIGDMQLGIIGRVSKWCIPTFLEGIASHRKYRILLTFSRFRVQVPRNLLFREPLPLNQLRHETRLCLEPINAMWKKTHSV